MATRSTVRFHNETGRETHLQVQTDFYHHHDGYIEGVGQDLINKVNAFMARSNHLAMNHDGESFDASNFVSLTEHYFTRDYKETKVEDHGDTEYHFDIKVFKDKIYVEVCFMSHWDEENNDYLSFDEAKEESHALFSAWLTEGSFQYEDHVALCQKKEKELGDKRSKEWEIRNNNNRD